MRPAVAVVGVVVVVVVVVVAIISGWVALCGKSACSVLGLCKPSLAGGRVPQGF